MTDPYTAKNPAFEAARRTLADRLWAEDDVRTDALRAAVEAVPREVFVQQGVLLPTADARWEPVTADRLGQREWAELVYRDDSLVTQLDGHITVADIDAPVAGFPTASSTMPSLVASMIEDFEVVPGMNVLELGTGTGYSTALLTELVGEDQVTSIEVDAALAERAEKSLNEIGLAPWTYPGDGLLGYPPRAPYDRVIATFAVRRIPYAWVRQTRPGGIILATVGTWAYGTGLAKLTVTAEGTAKGRLIRRTSFMPARAQTGTVIDGDLAFRMAYADTERTARLDPEMLGEWMPAFLAQLAAPGTQLIRSTSDDGEPEVYLFDIERESFAALTSTDAGWRVRQGGPAAVWDVIEDAMGRWQQAGSPDIDDVELTVTQERHTYGFSSDPGLRWVHQVAG